MRKFSSYGQINTKLHYYAPRTALIERAYTQLVGENPEEGGHYITVWAPRQTGKSSVMLEVVKKLQKQGDFTVAMITMQSAKEEHTDEDVLDKFVLHLREWFHQDLPDIRMWQELSWLFTPPSFTKPVILIIDGFDALEEEFIT